MKKVLLIAIAFIGLTSCEKEQELNFDPDSGCFVPLGESGSLSVIYTQDGAIISSYDSDGNLESRRAGTEWEGMAICDPDEL